MNKKVMTFVVAMVLLLGVTLGITFALMTDTTKTITNVFVAGNFGDLSLIEVHNGTRYDADSTDHTVEDFVMVPGAEIEKAPYVTFTKETSNVSTVADYVIYVRIDNGWTPGEVTGENDAKEYVLSKNVTGKEYGLSFTMAEGWLPLTCVANVYYKAFTEDVTEATGHFIKDDYVKVSELATEDDIDSLEGTKLIFTAYAVQKTATSDTAEDLWTTAAFSA